MESEPHTPQGPNRPQRWFDRESPYFRQRAAIFGAWLLLTVLCFSWALSGGETNDLQADLRIVNTGFGIAIAVKNGSDEIWNQVQIRLDGGKWVLRKPAIRPNERFSVQVHKFVSPSDAHKHPAKDLRPSTIEIVSAEASYSKRFR